MDGTFDVIITGVAGLITTFVGAWVSWFFARKKYNSEVDNQLITNMKESLDFYRQLSDDNKQRLTEVLEQNNQILKQNAQLLEQNTKLEEEVKTLKEQVRELTTRLKEPRKKKNEKVSETKA